MDRVLNREFKSHLQFSRRHFLAASLTGSTMGAAAPWLSLAPNAQDHHSAQATTSRSHHPLDPLTADEMSQAVSMCWRISGRPCKLSWKIRFAAD